MIVDILWWLACKLHFAVLLVYVPNLPDIYVFPTVQAAEAWVGAHPDRCVYDDPTSIITSHCVVIADAAHEFFNEGDQCRFR